MNWSWCVCCGVKGLASLSGGSSQLEERVSQSTRVVVLLRERLNLSLLRSFWQSGRVSNSLQYSQLLQQNLSQSISDFSWFRTSESINLIFIDSKLQMTTHLKFKIGQEVLVSTKEIQDKKGIIKYIGKIEGKNDDYVGVELEEPCGKNSGDVDGKVYFQVDKKSEKGFFGVFVKPMSLKPVIESKKGDGRRIMRGNPPPPVSKTKLSNELMDYNELQQLKEELEKAYEQIRSMEEMDAVKEVESLKQKLKEYEELNRNLKLSIEQTKYQTDSNQEEKLKELGERLQFFKAQKESVERERSELKKKIERLEKELEEGAEWEQMLEKLTFKIEGLEAKNEKLKSDLQAANTQLKNTEMLGGGKSNEELQQNITTLNQMISLLESDLNQEKQKSSRLQNQLETSSGRLNELVKLERKLKSKEEEIDIMKNELEAFSDAAVFVEKLTLDLIAKEENIREQTKKLRQSAETVNKLELQANESHQMVLMQSQQMEHLQDQIQKLMTDKTDQQKHITLLNDQISKYKQRIRELSENNSSLLMNLQDREDDNVIKNYFNVDIYQHKFYQLSKIHQATQEQFLQFQLSMASIRQYAGIFLSNIYDTLPEKFSLNFYPNLTNLLLRITSTNHNLYLLFELCSQALTHKSELYTADQESIATWLLILLEQVPELYNSLFKIELAITSADTEEDISQIIGHPELKEQLTRIDVFTSELLQRIISQTIDVEVSIDPYVEPIQLLDDLSLSIKRLPTELATRHELCLQTMRGVHQILSSIELYHRTSEARQTAQVDILLQNFLKLLEAYMRECCINPHIRLKTDMKSFISGVDLIVKILKQIELNDNLQELSSLYSDTEDIKMLKETIMTTQFHLKELQNDLEQISYPSALSRVHVKLPGKLWQEKLKSMREELARFQTTISEKNELQQAVLEQKKKIIYLQKDIKDRQATKQLHERRIGQLQLKVEQSAFIEADFKRQTEKLKSLEEASKIIQDELSSQSKKKKELEQQLRKTKQTFDTFQRETIAKQKTLKSSSLSSQDLSNLSIFKSVIFEAGSLRNHLTKHKIHELNFSQIMQSSQISPPPPSNRRSILNSLIDACIGQTIPSAPSLISPQLSRKSQTKNLSAGRVGLREGKNEIVWMNQSSEAIVSY